MQKTKLVNGYPHIPYIKPKFTAEEMIEKSGSFYTWMNERRTVRDFANTPVPLEVIEKIVLAAATAPSGAHKQPWIFCVVSDPIIKEQIRIEAEKAELEGYSNRMPEEWLNDLVPFGTDWKKPFLEKAPYLIIIFKRSYEIEDDKQKKRNYYASESVGIACGFLLAAIHNAGLAALTHTPSPMNFLAKILNRPENEKPFLLIPVGYPADECWVPDIKRKELNDVFEHY